ncbi:MAG: DNA repair protein RecN [Rhizobiaceae bacterium]
MLVQLSIRDIVLIERLEVEFSSGLSVLTGETGAGKSILLDALSLALGARGDGGLVRVGCEQGQVVAMFEPAADHRVRSLLRENGIDDDASLILRRVQGADGRTRAYVNDSPVSVALMREIGQMLVEIHGQHDDRALVDQAAHRRLLDAFGGLEADGAMVAAAWSALSKARKELKTLRQRVEDGAREKEYLRASVDELTRLAMEPGEEDQLAARRAKMMKVEKIATDINEANELLSGQASPLPSLSGLLRRLERKSAEAPGVLDSALSHLDHAVNALHSAQQELETALRETEFDPGELERVEERLFGLRAAARKYAVPVDGLANLAVRMADELHRLDTSSDMLQELEKREKEHEAEYDRIAARLSQNRKAAGINLCQMVAGELPALKLDQAEFMVDIDTNSSRAGPAGMDDVEFHVRTNPGTNPGPMMKVASGGELSRFLLALKVSLADRGSAPTLVFDEIDSGAGGAVADAIGRRLSRLASRVQVLSVTHAPQVAARAEGHLLISKAAVQGDARRVSTNVLRVEGEARREEIARMLSGATITDEARRAADKLIAQPAN